eukprot:COSAG06_NODE_25341_length_639_cov_1.142593_1_plen_168_part_01
MDDAGRREDRYTERGDGSLRPRMATKSPPLTQPVWQAAPFGVEQMDSGAGGGGGGALRTPPAARPAKRRVATSSAAAPAVVSPIRDCMIMRPSAIRAVGGRRHQPDATRSPGIVPGAAMDEGGAIVSSSPRGSGSSFSDRDRLLAARRSTSESRVDAYESPRPAPQRK